MGSRYHVMESMFNNIIPSDVSNLLALPNIKQGVTGLLLNSVCNGDTVITSARYVHVYKHFKVCPRALGSTRGIRGIVMKLMRPRGRSSFYREVIRFNESIYATHSPGYRRYPLTRVYGRKGTGET